jgi:peptide/nickel transport system ATP-binding protein/oligopeptide transport system ATP-binding protein
MREAVLAASTPDAAPPRPAAAAPPLLEVENLTKHYPVRRGLLRRTVASVRAVDGVSFALGEGETLGLVGESGCGKSTLGRTVLRLIAPSGGTIRLAGEDITGLGKRALRPHRRDMQIIFQDPFSSLNPRMRVGDIVAEPLKVHGLGNSREREALVDDVFEQVGLSLSQKRAYPHEFSGGQRQRICIARALVLRPKLIVCDEPVAALDVSIQAQVINLLADLQRQHRLSYLFIAHDLAVVAHISRRVAVMYLGRIVEQAETAAILGEPLHPYTEALLASVPVAHPRLKRARRPLPGDVPSPIAPPSGCAFHTRCPYAEARCRAETPLLREVRPGHVVACHLRG